MTETLCILTDVPTPNHSIRTIETKGLNAIAWFADTIDSSYLSLLY